MCSVRSRSFLLHAYAVLLVDMAMRSDKFESYKERQSKRYVLVNACCMVLSKEGIPEVVEEEEGENKGRRETLNLLSSEL